MRFRKDSLVSVDSSLFEVNLEGLGPFVLVPFAGTQLKLKSIPETIIAVRTFVLQQCIGGRKYTARR